MNILERKSFFAVITFLLLSIFYTPGAYSQVLESDLLKEMKWRNLGPGNFSGRIVDVEALDNDFRHVLAASASGGVWKSVNAGTTWEPIFDNYASASIGDIALFQRDPNIIWVGTGEANNRNSVAWGDGIYKSVDGGKTFENMGLKDTYQISRVITHPRNKDIVYVAAIGNLWGYSGDRGLFKTINGGKTWTKLAGGLPDDGKTGAIDLVMDRRSPGTLYVAMYERLRKPYRFDSGGPNGGIFKSTDSGRTWRKLTRGLPSGDTGRIGLDIYRSNPNIIMAIVEHGFQPNPNDPDYYDMKKLGTGIYRSEDGGESWTYVNRFNNRPFYYSQIRINPLDHQRVYVLTTTIQLSDDGGKTLRSGGLRFEGGLDYHGMWVDPTNKDRYYLAKDKGLTLTHDHGYTFSLFDNIPVGQFYAIGVDMRDPYYIYGGTQDNGTWGGPSFSRDVRGIQNDSWWKLHWGDGMFIQPDPTDWRKVYTEAEGGSFRRYNAETRQVEFTRPSPQNVINYKEYVPSDAPTGGNRLPRQHFRFNWRSPLVLSPHNPGTIYLGGNHLFKSIDEGYTWQIISPDLSTNDPIKTDPETGGLTRDVTGAETHGAITAFSESFVKPGLLWVGTDDGNVQITRNGGVTWKNVRSNIPDVPNELWVSSLEASHFDEGTSYITFDGHRSDNYDTWVFKTTDYGETWTNITNNLPEKNPMYVIREDLKNKNLLFAGSEFAVYVSLDAGDSWTRLMNNMPTVAIHDLVIHPRDGDLIAGTHGRGFWVLDDITPLQQLTDEVLESEGFLFENRHGTFWEDASRGGVRGHQFFAAENPPYIPKRDNIVRAKLINGVLIHYYIKEKPKTNVIIEISDLEGTNRKTIQAVQSTGINRELWNMRFNPTDEQMEQFRRRIESDIQAVEQYQLLDDTQKSILNKGKSFLEDAATDDALNEVNAYLNEHFSNNVVFRRRFGGTLQGQLAEPGEYLVRLMFNNKEYISRLKLRPDPMNKN